MRRLFQFGVPRFRSRFQPFDVAADTLENSPQRIHLPLLSKKRTIHLLQFVLHVHEQSFDCGQPFGGHRIVRHR